MHILHDKQDGFHSQTKSLIITLPYQNFLAFELEKYSASSDLIAGPDGSDFESASIDFFPDHDK